MNLPNNIELERQIIGQCLVEKRVVAPELTTPDFYNTQNRKVWDAICKLDETQQEIEPFAIVRLVNDETVKVTELSNLGIGLVFAMNMAPLVTELKSLSMRRYLMRALSAQIGTLETDNEVSAVVEILEGCCQQFHSNSRNPTGFQMLSDIVDTDVTNMLNSLTNNRVVKLPTGFPALDKSIGGGLTPSDIMLVVSDTGGGKSAFVLQMADQLAKEGYGVAYVSGEMRNRENVLRLLSQNAKTTNLNSVMRISAQELEFLTEWIDAIKNRPIFFDHSSGDMHSVRTNLKALMKKQKIDVLVLDYIQLYRMTRHDRLGHVERITEVSQEVKRIANEFGIAVLEVAQINREGAKKEKASMHDLEGSGQLEKDASLILMIDRLEDTEDIEIRIVKGRNASKGMLQGRFEGRTLTFTL